MDTKLLSDIVANVNELKLFIEQLIRERDAFEQRAIKAEQALEWLQDFTVSAKVEEIARDEGIPPKQWIAEKLTHAIEHGTDLPIDPRIHEMFVDMARGRSISLTELGTSVNMTDLFRELFDNRRI